MITRFKMWFKDKIHGKPEPMRSAEWPRVREEHLKCEPICQWCGRTVALEVHHIVPFHNNPLKELDEHNLITLCESERKCHLMHGHLGSWKDNNPNIRKQCNQFRKM